MHCLFNYNRHIIALLGHTSSTTQSLPMLYPYIPALYNLLWHVLYPLGKLYARVYGAVDIGMFYSAVHWRNLLMNFCYGFMIDCVMDMHTVYISQKLTLLHLFTGLFCKKILHSSEFIYSCYLKNFHTTSLDRRILGTQKCRNCASLDH